MGIVQDREHIQESFCAGKTKVVVATVAFGMGVDAQGVRGVVHMTLPRSLEEYVQQVMHRSSRSTSQVCQNTALMSCKWCKLEAVIID